MLRRKKILKLKAKQKKLEEKLATKQSGKNVKRALSMSLRKRRLESTPEWKEEYVKSLKSGLDKPLIAKPEAIGGIGVKHSVFDTKWKDPYKDDPNMAIREEIAIAEAEKLKARAMPIANKMGYQYITDGMIKNDIKTLGKKI